MTDVALSWSGGKDAAMALWELRRDPDVTVVDLLTTVSAEHGRVSMHGVRGDLLRRQAAALDLPLTTVELPADCPNDVYEDIMAEAMADYGAGGVDAVAFADLFLEDVRAYREAHLEGTALEGLWPVWGRDTDGFVRDVLDAGFRARTVCVDGAALDESWAGRELDDAFLTDLPAGVDPCGEHGEFHTFVWDGPVFDEPVPVEAGEAVTRAVGDGEHHYCELVPTEDTAGGPAETRRDRE